MVLDTNIRVGVKADMKATLIFRDKVVYPDGDIAELVIWRVPAPVPPSTHSLKYRLVYASNGSRMIGFDNERGKGDHRHDRGIEMPYAFVSVRRLIGDFTVAVQNWRHDNGKA